MRTFSEEEAREVFARAAREQQAAHEAGASDEGLTLDELQEIGRASGLDPAFVAAAAAGIGALAPSRETPTLLGMPTEATRTRILPGPLSDEAWEESVEALRTLFGGPGTSGQVGRVREWRSPSKGGWSAGLETHLTVRPLPDGRTRVHVEQAGLKSNARGVVATAGGVAAMALIPLVIWATGNAHGGGPFAFAAAMLFAALVLGAAGALWATQTARSLDARFEAALDRIELLARADAPMPDLPLEARDLGDDATIRPAASQLDFDALVSTPAEAPLRSGNTRTRT